MEVSFLTTLARFLGASEIKDGLTIFALKKRKLLLLSIFFSRQLSDWDWSSRSQFLVWGFVLKISDLKLFSIYSLTELCCFPYSVEFWVLLFSNFIKLLNVTVHWVLEQRALHQLHYLKMINNWRKTKAKIFFWAKKVDHFQRFCWFQPISLR